MNFFLLLHKGYKQSDDKMDYKKAIISEILSLDEFDNGKVNNNDTSKEIDHFAETVWKNRFM